MNVLELTSEVFVFAEETELGVGGQCGSRRLDVRIVTMQGCRVAASGAVCDNKLKEGPE